MRARHVVLSALSLLVITSTATSHPSHYAKTHDGVFLPDPHRTRGKVALQDTDTICATKWGRDARHVTEAMKRQVYEDYGVKKVERVCCEVDHLIPRDLGGADDIANLWPQPWTQAHMKDEVEVWLNKEVCAGRKSLQDAQERVAAYFGDRDQSDRAITSRWALWRMRSQIASASVASAR